MIQQITSNPCGSVFNTVKDFDDKVSQLLSPSNPPSSNKRTFSSVEELEHTSKKVKHDTHQAIIRALKPYLIAYPHSYIEHLPDGTIWRDSVTGAAVDITAHNLRVQKWEQAVKKDFERQSLPYFVPTKPEDLKIPGLEPEQKSFKQWAAEKDDSDADVSELDLNDDNDSDLDSLFEEPVEDDDELIADIEKIAHQNELEDDFKDMFDPQGL